MADETALVVAYEKEYGYKPESLQKLQSFNKEFAHNLKYTQVRSAFESMKQSMRSGVEGDVAKEVIKNEDRNWDINNPESRAGISTDLESAAHKEAETEKQKPNTFVDLTEGIDVLRGYEMAHDTRKTIVSFDELENKVLSWAHRQEQWAQLQLLSIQNAYPQYSAAYHAMHSKAPTTKQAQQKNKKKNHEETKSEEIMAIAKEELEMKSFGDIVSNATVKQLYQLFVTEHSTAPKDAKQLWTYGETFHSQLNLQFSDVNTAFKQYQTHCDEVESKRALAQQRMDAQRPVPTEPFDMKKSVAQFRDKYGNVPPDPKPFFTFIVTELGYTLKFTDFQQQWDTFLGKAKPKKAKGKPGKKRRDVMNLYAKSKTKK